jgi:phosphate transport system ATP-binding protein
LVDNALASAPVKDSQPGPESTPSAVSVQNLRVMFGEGQEVLKNISLEIPPGKITAVIGPSGCGKSTLLKTFCRLLEVEVQKVKIEGKVLVHGEDIYSPGIDATDVRRRVGLLAQRPFPLPMSIFDNVAYGPRLHGMVSSRKETRELVAHYLELAGLWEEVKDRLKSPATRLSIGQQQRLCLARGLAVEPEILLCDESTASLDPISAKHIENRLRSLKEHYTIVLVTHILRQARRLADHVAFMWLGELVEYGPADAFFNRPTDERTRAYIRGE